MILLLRNRVRRRYLSVSVAFLNPYSTLGISPGASKKEVKNAYRKKAKECHPDLHPGDEKKAAEFIKVQEAYESIQNGTASSAGGSSESTSQRMRQQKSWADRGFGSEQKQGFDFEYNYRQRMKARAEWERIKKEREARGDEHAYQHHARWSQDAGYGEYDKDFRHYQRNEFHGHRENFKRYDYQSDEFRRRAQRVRENLHKNEQFAQHEQAYRDKQDEWAAQRRAEFEKLFQTRTEDAVNESRAREQELKAQLSKIFFIFSLIFFAVSANNYMEMRERIENEEFYRQSQNKFQNGDLSNFNEHTRRHLQRMQSSHIQPTEETLAPDQEAILAVLEENSKMLKAKDSVGLASSKY